MSDIIGRTAKIADLTSRKTEYSCLYGGIKMGCTCKNLLPWLVLEEKPVVCLVFNGGRKVLRLVRYALQHDMPVIAVKGSGGFAEVIACIYFESDIDRKGVHDLMEKHIHRKAINKEDVDIMMEIQSTFKDRLTIYSPTNTPAKGLDRAILDALLRCKKFSQAGIYLQILQRKMKEWRHEARAATRYKQNRRETLGQQKDERQCLIQNEDNIIDLLIESLVVHTPSACAAIIRSLRIPFRKIPFHKLMMLYEKSPIRIRSNKWRMQIIGNHIIKQLFDICKPDDGDDCKCLPNKKHGAVEDAGVGRYRSLREDLRLYCDHLMATPLRCSGKKCARCRIAQNFNIRTCLPPQQELFLWSLFFGNQDLSGALLEHVEGKIGACLFAFAVYTGMALKEKEPAEEQALRQKASHFEELATVCLRNCYQEDKICTAQLLIQPSDTWDGFSPLQMSILTESMAFVAEDATKTRLDMIWNGSKISVNGMQIDEAGFVNSDCSCRDDIVRIFTPAFAYGMGLVFQLLFLLLFSYVLLYDLQTTPTWGFILLAIYVADLAADELRQLLMGNPVLKDGCSCKPQHMFRGFKSQKWNILDIAVIVLFALGMLVFVDNEVAFAIGRILLSLDALLFFLRFLQMLLYFKNLGIFLVMAKKSLADTGYFMLILLTVMWGYLVSSQGMQFPPPNNITSTWTYILDLPFKGYWQAFNLDLQAISVCQEVTKPALEDGDCKKESVLATQYGHHISSVLLALYLIFINVLLMNLLIAKFNNTFTEVYRQAKLHQSWQYCQLVLEYYVHTPAPFSVLSLLVAFILSLLTILGYLCAIFCGALCCCYYNLFCSKDHTVDSMSMNAIDANTYDLKAIYGNTEEPGIVEETRDALEGEGDEGVVIVRKEGEAAPFTQANYYTSWVMALNGASGSDRASQNGIQSVSTNENPGQDGNQESQKAKGAGSESGPPATDGTEEGTQVSADILHVFQEQPDGTEAKEENEDDSSNDDNSSDDEDDDYTDDDDDYQSSYDMDERFFNASSSSSLLETKQMMKLLRQSEEGSSERTRDQAPSMAHIQQQLDQLRYGLQQVLRRQNQSNPPLSTFK